MIIKARQVVVFELITNEGDSLGLFRQICKWNGLIELRALDDDALVIAGEPEEKPTFFESAILQLSGAASPPVALRIVSAAQRIADRLREAAP